MTPDHPAGERHGPTGPPDLCRQLAPAAYVYAALLHHVFPSPEPPPATPRPAYTASPPIIRPALPSKTFAQPVVPAASPVIPAKAGIPSPRRSGGTIGGLPSVIPTPHAACGILPPIPASRPEPDHDRYGSRAHVHHAALPQAGPD